MSVIAKYKFNKNVCENLIPVFNEGYTGYAISDEIDSVHSNYVIRTIECDISPTYIRFGLTETESNNNIRISEADALMEIISLDISGLNSLRFMFRFCKNLTSINTSDWDTSEITDLYSTFQYCHSLTSIDVSNWDTSNVTIMATTFGTTPCLTSIIGVENWNVSKVTTIAYMFCGCGLKSLDLGRWNTESLKNMAYTFWATPLQTLNVSGWNTSKVTTMHRAFKESSRLTSLDLSNWDVSNVTDMYDMFYECTSLTSIGDVSNWNTSNVTTMAYMFYRCCNLTSIDVSNWDTSNVTDMNEMFESCSSLTSLDVSNWDTSKVTRMDWMFFHCLKLKVLDVSNWDTSKVNNMSYLICDCEDLEQLSINSVLFDQPHVISNTPSLKRIITGNNITINTLSNNLDSRTGKEPGYIITSIRDQIDEETIATLAVKNWQIKDLVAQYRYDANTYEDLIPEFNPEFTEDMYEVHDIVSEIVIDNFGWERGSIHNATGANTTTEDYEQVSVRSKFIPIKPNIEIEINKGELEHFSMFYYDNNKSFIGVSVDIVDTNKVLNKNVKFIRLRLSNKNDYNNFNITAKLVTRSIESKNGDLPTLMRFGYNGNDTENNEYSGPGMSLIKILDMNTKELTTGHRMFKYCKRVESINANWDTSKIVDMFAMFYYCINLTSLDVSGFNTSEVTDMNHMFAHCRSLTSLDVSNFNTSNATNMSNMFYGCNNLTSLDVSNFDTSNVIDMSGMFRDCHKITSLDVSNFDTSKVTDMNHMFCNCHPLTSLDVSNFDTSKVTSMHAMFHDCGNLTSLDVSNWDTSNVISMNSMFTNCRSLTSLNLINWDVSKVTNMNRMFIDCRSLTSLDLSTWELNLRTITYKYDVNYYGMFQNCNALKKLILGNGFNTSLVDIMVHTFYCNNLIAIDLGGFDISNVTNDKSLILEHVPKLRYIRTENAALIADLAQYFPARTEAEQGYLITKANVSNEIRTILAGKYWNVVELDEAGTDVAIYKFDKSIYKSLVPMFNNNFVDWFMDDEIEDEVKSPNIVTRTIRSMGGLPTLMRFGQLYIDSETDARGMKRAKSLRYVDYLNTNEITDMQAMFRISTVVTIAASNFNTSKVTNMQAMFQHCRDLTSIGDVSNWDTSKVTNMNCMFQDCDNLTSLDVSNWDTSNVINMTYMFYNCNKLTSLDLSNFNTSKVTSMSSMFYSCNNLTSLDLSNFNTSKVNNMANMFYYCNRLTSLDVSGFNTSNVTNMESMFAHCKNLTSLDVSNFDTSKVTRMHSMFAHCNKLTSLDVSNFNTGKVTRMDYMFYNCNNLTSLDVSGFDTSKVTMLQDMFEECHLLSSLDVSKWNTSNCNNIACIFADCKSLKTIDVSNWNTSKMNSICGAFWLCESLEYIDVSNWDTSKVSVGNENGFNHVFCGCNNLTSLDLSNWSTTTVTKYNSMFQYCNNLTSLDISNFDTSKATNMHGMFGNLTTLSNIGMIYCDFKTIEKVASLVPTTNPTTIWVGNHIDFNALPQYDHITYKVYEVEDKLEVELSSPLLEGDRLEIIDGGLYHYHKAGTELLDGSHFYAQLSEASATGRYYYAFPGGSAIRQKPSSGCIADIIQSCYFGTSDNSIDRLTQPTITVQLDITGQMRLYVPGISTLDEYKNWLKANPVTLVYELANPYYELVKPNVGLLNAEQGLYLNISDSVVPVVNHQDLCTLKLNYLLPNVQYKVKFKANNPGSIAINLGGTLVPLDVVEGWNEVMVTTPATLVDEYLKVNGSEDIKIQNVMVIDSDKDFDYFKGMNNTFDEIPVKNICKNRTLTYTHGVDEEGVSPQGEMNVNVNKGKVVTVVGKVSNNPDNLPISINLYNNTGRATGKNLFNKDDIIIGQRILTTNGQLFANAKSYSTDFIEVDPTKPLKIYGHYSVEESVYTFVAFYDANKQYIGRSAGSASNERNVAATKGQEGIPGISYEFEPRETFPSNCKYIRFSHYVITSLTGEGEKEPTINEIINGSELLQIEQNNKVTTYESFRNYVNDNPIFINPDENGNFAITIRADRSYANRIGFNVGDAFACEANDQVTITDLMVFEGDILDCHPTTYVDPTDTRYLVEYKSIGNPFGFGKNKLI